jgi:hypothetical protein
MDSRDKKRCRIVDYLNYMAETGLLSMNRMNKENQYFRFSIDIAGGSFMLVSACTSGLLAEECGKLNILTFRYLTPVAL